MAKQRAVRKKPRQSTRQKSRAEVSRYEYAQLCVQLGTLESQVKRNRLDLDIQFRRIAQLQDELDSLRQVRSAPLIPSDSLLIRES